MQLCINHLVEQRYFRQSAIELPDICLQEVFQGSIVEDGFCVEIEFGLYSIFVQCNYCLAGFSLLDKIQSNGSHGTVFLTLFGRLLAEG